MKHAKGVRSWNNALVNTEQGSSSGYGTWHHAQCMIRQSMPVLQLTATTIAQSIGLT